MNDGTKRPIAFASGTLAKTEQRYVQIEREAMLVVDAHSRWLEMEKMDTTISTKTIEKLQSLFSRYGVPSQ